MPNRIIREGILGSDRVNRLSIEAELFFRRLMSVVDDFGRFDGRPALMRTSCYRLRVDSVSEGDILKYLAECEEHGLIRMYAKNGSKYSFPIQVADINNLLGKKNVSLFLEYLNFGQHTRAKESKFPEPPTSDASIAPDACSASEHHPHRTCTASALHAQCKGTTDAEQMRPDTETVASSKTDTSSGGSEAVGTQPPAAGGCELHLPPKKRARPSFRGLAVASPERLDADYDRVHVPTIESYDDIHSVADPIVLAMAVAGDRETQSWRGWVRLASEVRRVKGRTEADSAWTDECLQFWGEMNAGERPRSPGAALTCRLKRLLEKP